MKQSVGSVLLVRKELADWIRTEDGVQPPKNQNQQRQGDETLRVPVLKDGHPVGNGRRSAE